MWSSGLLDKWVWQLPFKGVYTNSVKSYNYTRRFHDLDVMDSYIGKCPLSGKPPCVGESHVVVKYYVVKSVCQEYDCIWQECTTSPLGNYNSTTMRSFGHQFHQCMTGYLDYLTERMSDSTHPLWISGPHSNEWCHHTPCVWWYYWVMTRSQDLGEIRPIWFQIRTLHEKLLLTHI